MRLFLLALKKNYCILQQGFQEYSVPTEWEIHIGGEFFVICHCVEGN